MITLFKVVAILRKFHFNVNFCFNIIFEIGTIKTRLSYPFGIILSYRITENFQYKVPTPYSNSTSLSLSTIHATKET